MNAIETHFDAVFDMTQPLPRLFESQREAQDFMQSVIHEVFQELKSEGVDLPNEKTYLRDTNELLALYRRFAPIEPD